MTGLLPLLIALPIALSLILLCVGCDRMRRPLVLFGVLAVIAGSLAVAWPGLPADAVRLCVPQEIVDRVMLVVEAAISLYLLWVSFRSRRWLIAVLVLAQAGLLLPLELGGHVHAVSTRPLFVDQFSVIMTLIIGVIGGLICLYALDYMKEFHESHHPEMPDGRRSFFAILFLFLGAMFGIVFSNNLLWLYFFWEITTLCSFWLIGYKGNEESKNNALRAIMMNLAGGVGFAAAIAWLMHRGQVIELDHLLAAGGAIALLPAAFLAFAGITKSAQLPFSSWLLGAMVAPTPVSALLHSSTMVNAGVYLVIRLSPVLRDTTVGLLVALVGALTFMIASLAAITTSDAKKVLAYSTIANLGLIVLCGGIGTPAAVWAGVLLIVFHAIAKGLLFLCVGAIEHKLHSRDIEDMSGLILKLPRLSIMLQIGMAGMFLAPFGMLISKWAVLKAVVDAMPLLTIFIVFGSAATLFFWVKWMGKLLEVTQPHANVEKNIGAGEWTALYTLAALTFATCMLFPLLSSALIVPYVQHAYPHLTLVTMSQGNVLIMIIMMGMVALFPFSFLYQGRHVKIVDPYLAGANTEQGNTFTGSAGTVQNMSMRSYYLTDLLPEAKLMLAGVVLAGLLLAGLLLKVAL